MFDHQKYDEYDFCVICPVISVQICSLKDLLYCLFHCHRLESDLFYPFGHIPLSASQIFYTTKLVYCSVNLKPFVPGHVLVIPRRPVPIFDMLTDEEVSELMIVVKKTTKLVKQVYKANSVTVAIQDGPPAGQTVPHVHVHVLPRKLNDLECGDMIYSMLDNFDFREVSREEQAVQPDSERHPRSEAEMAAEAELLKNALQLIV